MYSISYSKSELILLTDDLQLTILETKESDTVSVTISKHSEECLECLTIHLDEKQIEQLRIFVKCLN